MVFNLDKKAFKLSFFIIQKRLKNYLPDYGLSLQNLLYLC
jgi:hypothetical protein